jgi:protein-disulfide isomerase
MRTRAALATLVGLACLACLASSRAPAAAQSPPAPPPAARELAEVDGEVITEDDLRKHLGLTLQRVEQQLHDLRRDGLDRLIGDRLLAREAARRGVSVQALTESEITSKVGPVTDADADAFHDANRARLSGTKEQLRERIREHLRVARLAEQRERVVAGVRARSTVRVRLDGPPVFRVTVALDGAPGRGSAGAPVTIVEFSDFHCPFCRQAQALLGELRARYTDRIRLVYKHLPLDRLHPTARRAAEAAECANDQARFWEYHDRLFAGEPDGSPEKLRALARELGLDVAGFGRCLDAGTHRARVQRDVDEAERLGVTFTPAFFVNGRLVFGPNLREAFARMIDEELAATPAVTPRAATSPGTTPPAAPGPVKP